MYLLADCNNFYVSCERSFNPALQNRPVIILSNNDGCAVALSNEAKKLGIPRGAPLFKWQRFLEEHGGVYLSSNYALYGDMSRRVMEILNGYSEVCEVYSIDEAFLYIDGLQNSRLADIAKEIRAVTLRATGIPLTIGIGTTKTLAKAANHYAKKNSPDGITLITAANKQNILKQIPIANVWGVGYEYNKFLQRHGVVNAHDLITMPENWVRQKMTVTMLRTQRELKGVACIKITMQAQPYKSIISSRSFGVPIQDFASLRESLAEYTSRACDKLRRNFQSTSCLSVYLTTNSFKDQHQYSTSASLTLTYPSNSTRIISIEACRLLKKIYRTGYSFKKCGIMLYALSSNTEQQQSLFTDNSSLLRDEKLMTVMDSLNQKYGAKSVMFGSEGLAQKWKMRRNHLSPAYTTRWSDLPLVK